jgi:dTDP-4-dehydrorhamnose reductase
MKLLVFGANGQAGSSLQKLCEGRGIAIDGPRRAELDVRDAQGVARRIEAVRPDWVVNFSAFHVLEACEDDFAQAIEVNAVSVRAMAIAARAAGAKFLTVSTDYVFDGRQAEPWREDAEARPLQAYGVSKRAGELSALAAAPDQAFVVRTCGLYSSVGSRERGGNFIDKRLAEARGCASIEIGSDIVCTPTSADAFAAAVLSLLEAAAPPPGIYHLIADGACSWAEFAAEAFARLGVACRVVAVDRKGDYGRIRRPANSVLANTRARALGITLPHWKSDLGHYLQKREARTLV